MIWIAVDKFGKRFMDEYPPAPQDTAQDRWNITTPIFRDYPAHPLLSDLR